MKQFNLLIVSKDPGASDEMLKIASRIFRKNFVLQAQGLEEANTLLNRLNINLLIIDMDKEKVDFKGLNHAFPQLTIIGITDRPGDQMVPSDPQRNRILLKRDFQADLAVELKAIRKDKGYPSAKDNSPSSAKPVGATSDFKNFFRLVRSH